MQQHRELAGDRHHRAFVGVLLATAFGDLQAVAPQESESWAKGPRM
jgi:hypothetical protein